MAKVKIEKTKITITFEQDDRDKLIEVKQANGPQEIGQDENGDPILEDESVFKPRQFKAFKMEATKIGIEALDAVRHVVEGLVDQQIAKMQAEKTRRELIDETDDTAL